MLWLSSVSTANSNIYVRCSQLNFTLTTPYESSINSLFTSLVDSASIYNFNKFEISPEDNTVYGLFQCRGDLSSQNCKDCVVGAISELKTACPMSTGGEIQFEGCYVKYENMSFFGVQEKSEVFRRCGPSIGYNSDVLNTIDGALAYLVGGNGQYYRGGDFGSIEGVAQCVQDLSLSDCQDCLSEACGRLRTECETSTWGDMYFGKCYIRYADHGNEDHVNNDNSSSNKSSGGNENNIWKWIIAIIAAVLTTGGLTFAFRNSFNTNTHGQDRRTGGANQAKTKLPNNKQKKVALGSRLQGQQWAKGMTRVARLAPADAEKKTEGLMCRCRDWKSYAITRRSPNCQDCKKP
ncbi:hypothetical protein E3N88_40570 [Mikania micrantha]|uniref:Gnk2-homologous domain-containing protein n=1 Tax=Mikania micrantha TaxID=192012 RepID=A0A5N6LMZ0_9ASTR|nr:hypothetical protein E3N88_40570 [Mikania micrantha]